MKAHTNNASIHSFIVAKLYYNKIQNKHYKHILIHPTEVRKPQLQSSGKRKFLQ